MQKGSLFPSHSPRLRLRLSFVSARYFFVQSCISSLAAAAAVAALASSPTTRLVIIFYLYFYYFIIFVGLSLTRALACFCCVQTFVCCFYFFLF